MKNRIIGILLIFLVTTVALANNVDDILKEADQLIAEKKYHSAFKLLNDSSEEEVDIVLKKVQLALGYFATSIRHETFGFKDLAPGEELMDIRGKEGVYANYWFPIGEVLEDLLEKHPEDWRIHKALGDYYYEVFQKYRGKWLKSDEEVLALADKYYRIAKEHGVYDFKALYFLGLNQLFAKDYMEAARFLTEALAIEDKNHPLYAAANYNLAYAYLYQEEYEKGLQLALKSYNLYTKKSDKADAAMMAGIFYRQLADKSNAIKYHVIAEELVPGNYYNLLPLMQLYLESAELTKADQTAKKLFSLKPGAPIILDEVMTSYGRNGYSTEFITLSKRLGEDYKQNDEAMGNIYFHIGFTYYVIDNYAEAKINLLKAKSHFDKCFSPGHEVFPVINDYLKQIESKKKSE